MARIKHTKNELKAQRDALNRYQRFLPTLELKRQQLQMEVRRVTAALEVRRAEEAARRQELAGWVRLFAENLPLADWLRLKTVRVEDGNIAGVAIPVFREAVFARRPVDLFATPPWVDDGLALAEQLMRLRAEQRVLAEQQRRLAEELRVTTQRVNLFEKVKIPETADNIRVIRIFLGDQQTAAVARAKMAKAKVQEVEISA